MCSAVRDSCVNFCVQQTNYGCALCSAKVRVGPESKKFCKQSSCFVGGAEDGRGTSWLTRFASGTADYLATAHIAPGRQTFRPSSRTKATARYRCILLQSLLFGDKLTQEI